MRLGTLALSPHLETPRRAKERMHRDQGPVKVQRRTRWRPGVAAM
jgi:hypothetical protein